MAATALPSKAIDKHGLKAIVPIDGAGPIPKEMSRLATPRHGTSKRLQIDSANRATSWDGKSNKPQRIAGVEIPVCDSARLAGGIRRGEKARQGCNRTAKFQRAHTYFAPWQKNNSRCQIKLEPHFAHTARSQIIYTFEPRLSDSSLRRILTCRTGGTFMAKFSIGDFIANGNVTGKVAAVFVTTEGQLRYAIENDGALQFAMETELAPYQSQTKAA
jgi:hypothetical protein